jgi:hypothetical protein
MTARFLRRHVRLLFHALLSRSPLRTRQSLGRACFHALRSFLRFHGWEGCEVEEEEQFDGTGA